VVQLAPEKVKCKDSNQIEDPISNCSVLSTGKSAASRFQQISSLDGVKTLFKLSFCG
jgi:hypothetical protein